MNNAMSSYKQTQFNTIGRADLTIMLYDGAIRFLEQAQEKIRERNMQDKGNLISRAIAILGELDASLNMQQGGEVAQNLHHLYLLSTKNLLMANSKVDANMVKSVQTNLEKLRDAFAKAMQTPEAKEMLQRMGPLPQITTNNTKNMQMGGDIHLRAEQLRQIQLKASALELAREKLNNALTEEEKLQAQQAISAILEKTRPSMMQSPVTSSLAQKASLAFTKASGQTSPVLQTETTASVSPNVQAETITPVQNRSTQENSYTLNPTTVPSASITPSLNTSALINRKMALYKNISNS